MVLMTLENSNKAAGQVEEFGNNWRKKEAEEVAMKKKIKKDLKMRAKPKKKTK